MPKVSTFPDASTPIADADVVYVVQGGNSRKATVDDLFTAPAFDAEVSARIDAEFNITGAAPTFACRAWVNFNGTGTPAIRASGNVSSITDNGVGDYTVNFTTAMPDANYAVCLSGNNTASFGYNFSVPRNAVPTASAIRLVTAAGVTPTDIDYIYVAIFR